jgi:hypothetical protein
MSKYGKYGKYGGKNGKNGGKNGGGVGVVMLSEYEDHSEAPTPFTALTL